MKKKISYVIIGLAIIAIGVLYAGDILGYWEIQFSFDGWWTLFIIVPAVVSMVSSGIDAINVILVGIGILLFLGARQALPNGAAYKLIFPYVIIVIGLAILFKKTKQPTEKVNTGLFAGNSGINYFAVFGGNTPQFKNVDFRGCNTYAVFGGIELHLREAVIKRDCVINAYSIFGGSDIFLPPDVHCVVQSTPIFGGVDNKFVSEVEGQSAPTIYIHAISIFGGIDIK